MIKTKKQMYTIIGAFALVMMLGTVTYAFFNYTRTGVANTIRTGRIYFNTSQNGNINLTNMFPIAATPANLSDNTKVGMVTIDVTGDTTYDNGVEYLVSAVDVNNTINNKSLPISISVSYGEASDEDVGTEDEEYFDNRGGNSSLYKVLAKDTISNNDQLIVGYIAKGATGIDGTITIKAYLDNNKILISDTYPSGDVTHTEASGETSIEVVDYTNGTPSSMAEGKTVFTTDEWNSLQVNGVSFKVKVESQEGTWVEEVRSINAMNTFPTAITDEKANIKEVYFNKMGATRMQNAYDAATIKADLTYNNEGKVLAWLETNPDDDTKYNLYVASDGTTYLTTGYELFAGYSNMDNIEFNNIDTSRVTNMMTMFAACTSLSNIDISSFNTSNVTNMIAMFVSCSSLTNINLDGKGGNNLTAINGIFQGCTNLKNVSMHNFNFGLISTMDHNSSPFRNTNIESLDLSNSNMLNVTNASRLFYGSSNLQTLNMSNVNLSNLSQAQSMFSISNLERINLSGAIFNNISEIQAMFSGCSKITELDLSGFNTSHLINYGASGMFENCTSLEKIYVDPNKWDLSNQSNNVIFLDNYALVGGNGTHYSDDNPKDKTYAIIDGTNGQPGYLTDIADKPTS